MGFDIHEVTRLTGFSAETRNRLARYYARMPDPVRIEAHRMQTDLVRQARADRVAGREPEFYFAQFLIALHKMQSMEAGSGLRRKTEQRLTDEELARITVIRSHRVQAEHKKKPSTTKDRIEHDFYIMVSRFRDNEVSWRDIAIYLGRYHRFRISHNYLKKCFEQITADRKIRGDV